MRESRLGQLRSAGSIRLAGGNSRGGGVGLGGGSLAEKSAGAGPGRAVLELRPPPFAVPSLWVAGVCLGVAMVGILVPDFYGEALPSGWGSVLGVIGRGALALGIFAMAAGALWRPRLGGEIEFHPEHLELPRLGAPAGRTRIPYTEVIGVHPWSLFRTRALVFGSNAESG